MANRSAPPIEVRGARQNNLCNVDLNIPKGKLVVFTGVSGSGKSSLVFDTIAAESQRLINETYNAFLQSLMPSLPRPDVDSLSNLSAAIVVDQEPMGANLRSTVGTATDTWTMLRILFARAGKPAVSGPSELSFNDPTGMCDVCEGVGRVSALDLDQVLDRSLSLNDGAIVFPNFAVDSLFWKVYAGSGLFDNDKPLSKWSTADLDQLLRGEGDSVSTGSYNLAYEGVLDKIQRLYLDKDIGSLKPHVRRAVEAAATFGVCPTCDGSRLGEAGRSCSINAVTIAECSTMQINQLAEWVRRLDLDGMGLLVASLSSMLDNLVEIGLGYLSLDRQAGTLSGGEAQRVKMVRHLDSALCDVTYVFDEPTTGLHAHDTARMIGLLEQLRDKGNTVLVVEHDPDVITAADHVIDIGPGAGADGGTVCFQGTVAQLKKAKTLTGRHLGKRQPIKIQTRQPEGSISITDASANNLDNVSVDIPLGVLVAITGVAGSGKSTLTDAIPDRDDIVFVDQSPIKGSQRSAPATYIGVFDHIRTLFAKANDVKPSMFSFNSDGACDDCNGLGVVYTDLAHLGSIPSPCPTCDGRRYGDDVLALRLAERSIADVLAMSITEAAEFFADETKIRPMLDSLVDVGIGYVALGQALSTLSGGERQRLRLAIELAGDANIYLLDEPTSGLHLADTAHLIEMLDRIVDNGASVIVVEHDLDVIARSDHIIDLGPGAGTAGGTIVYQGPPADISNAKESLTGQHLLANHKLETA
ncbi:MAG: ATP-binding cassette domain-containing protein [Acidimicrobiales bacterium]